MTKDKCQSTMSWKTEKGIDLIEKSIQKKSTLRQQRDYGEISLRAKHMNGSYENLDIVI